VPTALGFRRGMKINHEADKSERGLQQSRSGWLEFFDLADQIEVPDDFLLDHGDAHPQERDLFVTNGATSRLRLVREKVGQLPDAEVLRNLQRRAADAADHGRAVAAGERIVNFTRADRAIEQGMALAVGWWLRRLSHQFPRMYHKGWIFYHRDREATEKTIKKNKLRVLRVSVAKRDLGCANGKRSRSDERKQNNFRRRADAARVQPVG